uniref:Pollen-specific leucine-rich repeat extensin-like protein 1 n=1 Tax=Schistosoma mansoni TaxID=6183 RepID=A0A5K4F7D6_SCHMA
MTSRGSSELNETQNHCEMKVSNQPTSYQISHVIVQDIVCPNDSHISDEISYNSENNILNESNHDQKPDSVFVDADFSNDSLFSNETLNKFEGNISEKSNPDVISYIIYPHYAFASCGKLIQCEAFDQLCIHFPLSNSGRYVDISKVAVLTFVFAVNYLDVVHCDGDGAPSAPVGSPDQQPAAPAAPDSPTAPGAPAAPDAPPPASATPDSPATTKSTGRPKPSRRETRTAHPPRSPPRARSPHAPTHPRKYQRPPQDGRKSVQILR